MSDLGPTGQAIWKAYNASKLDAGSQALVRELARCADTLDRLDGLAAGRQDSWVILAFDEMGEVHLSVDKILDQRRNHQLAFKTLYAEIRAAKLPATTDGKPGEEPTQPEDMLAKLRKNKEQRERQSG